MGGDEVTCATLLSLVALLKKSKRRTQVFRWLQPTVGGYHHAVPSPRFLASNFDSTGTERIDAQVGDILLAFCSLHQSYPLPLPFA